MGSLLDSGSDKDVRIFVTFSRRVYYAGEMVEGAVHIHCLNPRPYRTINLIIRGEEKVRWTQSSGKSRKVYSQEKQTYECWMDLASLPGGIFPGFYSYPFSILLPANLPSTLYQDGSNYISLQVIAWLPRFDSATTDQQFKRHLNIREPPRGITSNLIGQTSSESRCCNCCCSCGSTVFSMEADVSYLVYGRQFRVRGVINAALSKTTIKDYKVLLREVTSKISSLGHVTRSKEEFVFFSAQKTLIPGMRDEFDAVVIVPPAVTGYTAIGSIFCRVYYLVLVAEVGCCYSNPTLSIHTILNTPLEPDLQAEEQVQPPRGWSPLVAQPRVFTNLPPYVYQPLEGIVVRNQEGPSGLLANMGAGGVYPTEAGK
jgi:hypothetical protein